MALLKECSHAGAPVTRWDHELMLMLEPGKSDLADASLRPADVEISDIAAAAEGGARSLEYMVREVHARLADRLSQAVGPQGAIPTTFFVGILLLICPRVQVYLSIFCILNPFF